MATKTATTTIAASELSNLVNEIRQQFMVLYQSAQSGPLPKEVLDASKRFDTWTETTQLVPHRSAGRASSAQTVRLPTQAKSFLTRLQFAVEDYGAAQTDEDRQESIRGILKQLQNLEQLQIPAVHADPNISEKDILQAKSVKHQYINNDISNQASVQNGDAIGKDYNGPFSEFTSIYRDNRIRDSAKVLNGDSYNAKSVFDD
ncbi:hypothetical protein HII31_06629 [Pseudocercospora fuligena]|uniref:Uncharacterized protein n=1 Tax=Pseudocercospora fuligena TaxID=685502 RepID=A0A8H6VL29_9PEZI|nr:hypothetical protein HII31_06629 [Pseudocercospora fuligena]